MILKYNVDIPPERRTRRERIKYKSDVMRFIESGNKNAELEVPPGSTFHAVVLNYRTTVNRLGLVSSVTVIQRSGRIFLERKEKAS